MSPCPEQDQLNAYAVGKLTEADSELLNSHLSQCHACNDTLDTIQINGDTLLDVIRQPCPSDVFLEEPQLLECLSRLGNLTVGDEKSTREPAEQVGKRKRTKVNSHRSEKLDRPAEFGNYRLLSKLGQGGMGAVYKALHTNLGKIVAIKVLSPVRLSDASAIERFEREMKAIGRVQHPNVVVAHDAGQIDGQHYLVMEYIDGMDVAELSSVFGDENGRLPTAVASEIIRQAAMGLQHAHDQGLIHRDIKPSNLMLDEAGIVKVLDMGLARIDPLRDDGQDATSHHKSELTASGTAMGTVGYMAPEQALDSRQVDPRTDIYSLGVTFYKLLSGKLPFPSDQYDTIGKMLVAITTKTPESIRTHRSDLPTDLVRIIDTMLAKKSEDRVNTAGQIAQKLECHAGINLAGFSSGKVKANSLAKPMPAQLKPAEDLGTGRKSRFWAIPALAMLPILLFAGQTFLIRTEYGTIAVEIADDEVEAKMRADGITVVDRRNNKAWTINSPTGESKKLPQGEYRFEAPSGLVITDDLGLEITAKEFKLLDANKVLRVRISVQHDESKGVSSNGPYQREIEAAKWVESVGGKLAENGPGSPEVTSAKIAANPGSLRFINLSGCGKIPDVGKKLANLPNLEIVFARDTSINPDDLTDLLTNRQLFWLQLHRTQLKSTDFRRLRDLRRLNSLGLDWSQVNDDWEFLEELPWLPEIDLTTTEPPKFEKLFAYQQLDTVWLDVDLSRSRMTHSELMTLAEMAKPLNPHLRIGINVQLVGTDPVREMAKRLSSEGWKLSGVYSNWKDPWDSTSKDAWSKPGWFHIRNIEAPDNLRLTSELLDSLPALGHAFDTVRFRGAANSDRLPVYLRNRVLNHLDLRDSDLKDTTLLKIADMSGVRELTIANTSVTEAGVEVFKNVRPACRVAASTNFDPTLPNSSILEANEQWEVASDAPREYELTFSLKRQSGNEGALLVDLPVMDQRVTLVLSGYGKTRSGLNLIDGTQAHANESSVVGDPLTDGQVHRVAIRVTKDAISTSVDGKMLFRWDGDFRRLSSFKPFALSGLHVICGQETRFQIIEWRLRDLSKDRDH